MTSDPRSDPEIKLARRKAQLATLQATFVMLVALGVFASLLLIIIQTNRLTEIAETNRSNGALLLDCTTPEGQCYRDGQARTGEAIGTINEVTILAAACVKIPTNNTEAEIRACIEAGLDR